MPDDRFEPPLHDAARHYHEPPELDAAARETIWAEVEAGVFSSHLTHQPHRSPAWIGLAAALVIGVALGRFTPLDRLLHPATIAAGPVSVRAATTARVLVPSVFAPTTSQYLGQTAALLNALPSEIHGGRADGLFIDRARTLLLTTRLLLDSPAAADARLRGLLDDLEVVLAQVVRLQSERDSTDLDLIHQALEQRDVLPRLRTVAADISAD